MRLHRSRVIHPSTTASHTNNTPNAPGSQQRLKTQIQLLPNVSFWQLGQAWPWTSTWYPIHFISRLFTLPHGPSYHKTLCEGSRAARWLWHDIRRSITLLLGIFAFESDAITGGAGCKQGWNYASTLHPATPHSPTPTRMPSGHAGTPTPTENT